MANTLITRARIEEEVRKALGATLRKDPESIDMDQSIVEELGATSIDFLDVNFRLETAFGIRLATQLLLDHVEEELGEGQAIDPENRITEGAAQLLRKHLGDLPDLRAGLEADAVPGIVTPAIVVSAVEGIVDHLPETCGSCGVAQWTSDDGAKVVCGACGEEAEYPSGDDLTKRWIHDVQREERIFSGV